MAGDGEVFVPLLCVASVKCDQLRNEVSRVEWDGYTVHIYIQTRSDNASRLLASLNSSAIKSIIGQNLGHRGVA